MSRVEEATEPPGMHGMLGLLRIAAFRRVVLGAALVLGSHALHDTFAVIRWSGAGISPAMVSVLWSEPVAAEVVVFFLLGPSLVTRLGAHGVMALAATAGLLRWIVVASTTAVTALAIVQPLHGLTFAALHLACMRVISATSVRPGGDRPGDVRARRRSGDRLLTVASGVLYARLGAGAFLGMALLCILAMPLALLPTRRG